MNGIIIRTQREKTHRLVVLGMVRWKEGRVGLSMVMFGRGVWAG